MHPLLQQIISLALQVLIALLAWNYYRTRRYPQPLKYATFAPRFWTGPVDACVLWPVSFAALALLTLKLPTVVLVGVLLVQHLLWLLYTVLMHGKYGQTVGKMVCKVRVVDFRSETQITYGQALLREGIPLALSLGLIGYEIQALLSGALSPDMIVRGELAKQKAFWLLASLPLLWFAAEAVTMLTNQKRRALHDFIAGTVVVRTNVD
jgi:uncharacterized RDD family membrane protein YckC